MFTAPIRRHSMIAAAAALLTAGTLAITAVAPPASADPAPLSYQFTSKDFGFAEGGNPSDLPQRFAGMQAFLDGGKPTIRIDMEWWYLQPTRDVTNDQLKWDKLDATIRAANAQGIRVLLILGFGVPWQDGTKLDGNGQPLAPGGWFPKEDEPWRNIIDQVLIRYAGMVQAFEVWNEPSLNGHYGNDTLPELQQRYWEITKIAYEAVKARCSACTVLAGASSGGRTIAAADSPSGWLDYGYRHGFGRYFDAVTYHPYFPGGKGIGPSAPSCPPDPRVWALFGPPDPRCGELAATRQIMLNNGDAAKKIWATEFGSSTNNTDPAFVQPKEVIRDYLVEGLDMWRSRDYTGPMFLYSFRDGNRVYGDQPNLCARVPNDAECNFGITDVNGNPKEPIYSDLKMKVTDQWPSSLANGSNMRRWTALRSPDSKFYLWFESNGNLSLYRARDARILWSSDTVGSAVTLKMQNDGNLVLYTKTGAVARSTGSRPRTLPSNTYRPAAEHPVAARLWMQEDGNLVLYHESPNGAKAVWASDTAGQY